MEKRQSGNGFNLFLFGVLIGALGTLLITTKKGRKILKVIMDEGVERFSKIEDVIGRVEEEMVEDEMLEQDPTRETVSVEPRPNPIREVSHEAVKTAVETPVPASKIEKIEMDDEPKKKRLFKGIRRRAS
ncbi:MAG: hypothetical protein KBC15_00120 [Candidatus Levybacteria bacterium]|nr:hypothetical protein [Candidatus Levybacteria bacterium]